MAIPQKECPQCKAHLALDTPTCPTCAHRFRTQFVSGVPLPPQPPPPAYAHPAPYQPPAYTPPAPAVPPEYQFGAVLTECTRQYQSLTWMRILSIFLIPAFFIGVIMWFLFNTREMDLRQRVAALGVDAGRWEASLYPQRLKTYAIVFGVLIGLPLLGIILLFSIIRR